MYSKVNIYVHQLVQKYVYDVGISSCRSNPSYEIGLNKWCCNDGEIDHFKYIQQIFVKLGVHKLISLQYYSKYFSK